MYCKKCGKELREGARFCIGCGEPVPMQASGGFESGKEQVRNVQERRPVENRAAENRTEPMRAQQRPAQPAPEPKKEEKAGKSKPKKGFSVLSCLVGIVLAAVLAAALVFTGFLSVNVKPAAEAASADRIEGSGYDSPEEAATAYVEALKTQDVSAMLSTFAVESLCEGYDSLAMMERLNSYGLAIYTSNPVSADENTYLEQLNVENRRRSLTTQFAYQYLMLFMDENASYYEKIMDGSFLSQVESSDFKKLISDLQAQKDFSSMEIIKVADASDVNRNFSSEANKKNLKKIAAMIGADKIDACAVVFEYDGRTGVVFMDVVKYGDKWYNYTMQGNLAALAGLSAFCGGMLYGDYVAEESGFSPEDL